MSEMTELGCNFEIESEEVICLKRVAGEVLLAIVTAFRKTRGQTPFELGIGYVVNEIGKPTGEIRLRTEQIESGVAPVVGILRLKDAKKLKNALHDAIRIAEQHTSSPLFSDE